MKTTWSECIDRIENAATNWLSSRLLVLTAFTVIYTAISFHLASEKLFWDDEFFTLYITTAPGWGGIMEALATGADQHPPLFYYLIKIAIEAFGLTPITLRLTAMVGFWLMCICLYELVSRSTDRAWGTLALLLPLSSPALYFATEARGYGMVVGCAALALFSWTLAADRVRRSATLPLLALSLAFAVGNHYYAVLLLIPLGIGELVRTWVLRRIDLPMWFSFMGALLPVVLFWSSVQSARSYSRTFWAVPVWKSSVDFLPGNAGFWFYILLAAIVTVLITRPGTETRTVPARTVPVWQIAAFAAMAALPLFGTLVGKLVTNSFTPRYTVSAVIGMVLLFCLGSARVLRQRAIVVSALIVMALGLGFVRAYYIRSEFRGTSSSVEEDISDLRGLEDSAVLVSEVSVFHRLSFYAPRAAIQNLAFPADPDLSITYLGHDTIDRGLLDLNPWFPINTVPYREFLLNNPRFYVYGYVGDWTWTTHELSTIADDVQIRARSGARLLVEVSGVRTADVTNRTSGYTGTPLPGLYAQKPRTGPSLCVLSMGERWCPDYRE